MILLIVIHCNVLKRSITSSDSDNTKISKKNKPAITIEFFELNNNVVAGKYMRGGVSKPVAPLLNLIFIKCIFKVFTDFMT